MSQVALDDLFDEMVKVLEEALVALRHADDLTADEKVIQVKETVKSVLNKIKGGI
jgi:hypothetical protein